MKLWIRIDVAIRSDPNVAELASRLHIDRAAAVGHCTLVWAAIAEHRPNGDLTGISVAVLESWAGWEPRRGHPMGTFAPAFIEIFVDEQCHLTCWNRLVGFRVGARTAGVAEYIRRRIFKRDGRICANCGATEKLQIDHVVAWIFGGADDDSNLQVLCRPCNKAKGPQAYALRTGHA